MLAIITALLSALTCDHKPCESDMIRFAHYNRDSVEMTWQSLSSFKTYCNKRISFEPIGSSEYCRWLAIGEYVGHVYQKWNALDNVLRFSTIGDKRYEDLKRYLTPLEWRTGILPPPFPYWLMESVNELPQQSTNPMSSPYNFFP